MSDNEQKLAETKARISRTTAGMIIEAMAKQGVTFEELAVRMNMEGRHEELRVTVYGTEEDMRLSTLVMIASALDCRVTASLVKNCDETTKGEDCGDPYTL